MIWVDSPYPPGTIAIARGELARFTDFDDSLDRVQVPHGTQIARLKGPSVARNRNTIVQDHFQGDWLCFVDDDQVIPPDTILKLLSHDRAIVGALYSTKQPPFVPIAHRARQRDGKYVSWTWDGLRDHPDRLIPCVGAGTGCMLIQRKIFQSVPFPWFQAMEFTDDLHFCQRALKQGWPIYVDREAVIGHTTTVNVWPALSLPGVNLQMNWLRIGLGDDPGDQGAAHLQGAQESSHE